MPRERQPAGASSAPASLPPFEPRFVTEFAGVSMAVSSNTLDSDIATMIAAARSAGLGRGKNTRLLDRYVRTLTESRDALRAMDPHHRLEAPTRAELFGLRHSEISTRVVQIAGRRVHIVESIATRGCFYNGYRRVFEAQIAAGRDPLGLPGMGGRAVEIIAHGHHHAEACANALAALEQRAK